MTIRTLLFIYLDDDQNIVRCNNGLINSFKLSLIVLSMSLLYRTPLFHFFQQLQLCLACSSLHVPPPWKSSSIPSMRNVKQVRLLPPFRIRRPFRRKCPGPSDARLYLSQIWTKR